MDNRDFLRWCDSATAKIKFKPDREAVAAELLAHLQDHRQTLIEQGMDPEEANEQALAAMGSPQEIAPQLAALHKPWVGYLYYLVKAAAILTVIIAVFQWVSILGSFTHTLVNVRNFSYIPANYGTMDYYWNPDVSDWSDGYRFEVTEAGYRKSNPVLYFELEMIYMPWLGDCNISHSIWAVDSMGNYYDAYAQAEYDDPTHVKGGDMSASSLIHIYGMRIVGFDTGAEWVELHYDRDGRDLVLHIDLPGGDGHD